MEYRCKICAGTLTIDHKSRVAVCDYCGTKQTLPLFGDDSSKSLYDRGNQYLLHNEYDKAENVFNQLLSVNPNDAEIYWDLVLCKYGVTYAKDPQTGRYIPTCNRTHTDSILKDSNYLQALELSVGEKAELYKRDAAIIDNIQKGILEVSKKEKPFDIFISYKETDENGNRTKDSIEAQKLYEKLTGIGYKVFFSRITLESKIGEEYEPYIYAALSSSKIMITICSSSENINAAWVKNEWNRFLTLRRGNSSKTLIPVYFDMDKSELPEEFSLLGAQDLRSEDFEQELIRGIKKIIPISTDLIAFRKKRNAIFLAVTTATIIVLFIVVAFMNGWIGKKAGYKKQYSKAKELYESGDYNEAKAIFEELGDFENSSEYTSKCNYQNAKLLLESGNYDEAKSIFDSLNDYKDSSKLADKCSYQKAQNLLENGSYDEAKEIFEGLGDYEDSSQMVIKCGYQAEYDEALQFYYDRNYPEACWALSRIGDYDEVNESLDNCKKSWRNSVSNIAFDTEKVYPVQGAYFIDGNGTVKAFSSNPGSGNIIATINDNGEVIGKDTMELNEHGKVVSIADNSTLYALYEDGHVSNSAYLNRVDSDWENVIQITDEFNVTNVALLADGTVIYGDTSSETDNYNDEWLKKTGEWKNIIKLEWSFSSDQAGGTVHDAILVGIDSDGNTYCTTYKKQGDRADCLKYYDGMVDFVNSLNNVKDITISDKYISALDFNNTLKIYNSETGDTVEKADVKTSWGEYYIDSKNNLKKNNSDNIILEGVVYVNNGYCISQNGSIYTVSGDNANEKTSVKDEWLER